MGFRALTVHSHDRWLRRSLSGGIRDGQTGTMTAIQPFGSGLQLNIHLNTLVLSGGFRDTRRSPGAPRSICRCAMTS